MIPLHEEIFYLANISPNYNANDKWEFLNNIIFPNDGRDIEGPDSTKECVLKAPYVFFITTTSRTTILVV